MLISMLVNITKCCNIFDFEKIFMKNDSIHIYVVRDLKLHVPGKRQGRNFLTEFSFNLYVLRFLSLNCNFGYTINF